MSFAPLELSQFLKNTLQKLGFSQASPIQASAIPPILAKKDVLGIAKTGSGKTAAYLLPIIEALQTQKPLNNRHIACLILVPTRELAMQVSEMLIQLKEDSPRAIKSMAVFGGVSINPQMIALQGVELLIATPGRLLELIESKAIALGQVNTLVLDEADKLFNTSFKEELDQILALLPAKRQNLLFSATLSPDVQALQQAWLKNAEVIQVEDSNEEQDELENIEQSAYWVSDENKGPLLRYLLRKIAPLQVLIFTSSIQKANAVERKLKDNGFAANSIHSDKSQGARNKALSDFKQGKLQALVSTDLLARGIDIEQLPYVINYELPRSPKDYIHRIGRTGRANEKGEAISLITPDESHHFKVIQKKMGKWVTMIESSGLQL